MTSLDPLQQRAWQATVELMRRLPKTLETQLQRELGITHFEYSALTTLSAQPGHRLQMSELAGRTHASLSRLSHVVDKLEQKGWAQRSTLPGQRGVHVTLTAEGQRKATDAAAGYLDTVRRLVFDGLDPTATHQLAVLGETISRHLTTPQASTAPATAPDALAAVTAAYPSRGGAVADNPAATGQSATPATEPTAPALETSAGDVGL